MCTGYRQQRAWQLPAYGCFESWTLAFEYLDCSSIVVGSKNWITPPAEMEEYYFAQASSILDAIHEQILPLDGYQAKHNYTDGEFARTSKKGV
jgi:2-oxoisovalerate dehydrogenase E1 component